MRDFSGSIGIRGLFLDRWDWGLDEAVNELAAASDPDRGFADGAVRSDATVRRVTGLLSALVKDCVSGLGTVSGKDCVSRLWTVSGLGTGDCFWKGLCVGIVVCFWSGDCFWKLGKEMSGSSAVGKKLV